MKLIYVAGPYRAESAWEVEKNIRRAEEAGLTLAGLGACPVIPHTMFRFFNGLRTDEFWLEATLQLLSKCDAVYMVPGWENSEGSIGEHAHAQAHGFQIFQLYSLVEAWLEK